MNLQLLKGGGKASKTMTFRQAALVSVVFSVALADESCLA